MCEEDIKIAPSALLAVEQLRCSRCNSYLSCSPIRLLSNGSNICGRCSPAGSEVSIAREVALETVLSSVPFPCRFKQYGCTELLPFGQTIDHESKCIYHYFACPASVKDSCLWKGLSMHMYDHFNDQHPNQVKEMAEFKVHRKQTAEEVFLVRNNNHVFIVKYCYDSKESSIWFDIRLCKSNIEASASYRLRLINNSDRELSINLKTSKCHIFDDTFYRHRNSMVLKLSKFIQILGSPDCVIIDLNLMVKCSNVDVDVPTCNRCYNYLLPPLFELNGQAICSACGKDINSYKILNNKELQHFVTTLDFPCRWRNCTVLIQSNNIQAHESKCSFRQYNCRIEGCGVRLMLNELVDHYKSKHNVKYTTKRSSFIFSFSEICDVKYIIKVKDNSIILLKYSVEKAPKGNRLVVSTFPSDEITGSLVFEHQHCKLRSKKFLLKNHMDFVLNKEFPSCFQVDDEFTVTVFV